MEPVTWGKPKIEFGVSNAGAIAANFSVMPTIEENTCLLTTVKGSAQELFGEGHELVARKMQKSYKQLAMSVFIPSGTPDPIQDEDGVIKNYYSVRLTPEDNTLDGFVMPCCNVEVEEEWSSAKGKQLKYIFSSLKPASGKMIQPYSENGLTVSPVALYFSNAADSTGKTVTASSTGNITSAVATEGWITVTSAAKVATVKVTANESGAVRNGYVRITADGKTAVVPVTQIPA